MRQKSVIECSHTFGVTALYDEILRFKASAAHGAPRNRELVGIRPGSEVLVQCVADNLMQTYRHIMGYSPSDTVT